MASKFIIFLVFAALAQSSSAVTEAEYLDNLYKMKEAGNTTLSNFYAVINGFFRVIDAKLENKEFNGEVILQDIIYAFKDAFDSTVRGLKPIATNTSVFEELEAGSKAAIEELVLTTWSIFDVTPASENLAVTMAEIEVLKARMKEQIGAIWNSIFDMILDSVNSEVLHINLAIGELRSKATAFAFQTGKAVGSAIEMYVTKFATGLSEEPSNYLEAFPILNNLGLVSMSAEVNEKFVMFQYIETYNFVSNVDNVKIFTRIMFDEIGTTNGLWEVFGGVLWFLDDENDSNTSYDTLEVDIYNGLQSAYVYTLDAIRAIPTTVDVTDDPTSNTLISELAARIREAVELAEGEITTVVSDKINEIKARVANLVYIIWKDIYDTLRLVAEGIEGAQIAVDNAWTAGAARMETAVNYLFRAIKNGLSEDFRAEEGILYSVGGEISTKFDVIRGLRLCGHVFESKGLKIPLSLVYNDQLTGPSANE